MTNSQNNSQATKALSLTHDSAIGDRLSAVRGEAANWEFIAECLRAELADLGGMLHLFETQQRSIFDQDADAVLALAGEIEMQTRAVVESRTHRERAVAAFAEQHDRPVSTSLRAMLPLIESDARPLVEALINQVNLMVHRVRRTSRHNHTLLARTVETHQETLQQLRPNAFTKTYSPAGRVSVVSAGPTATLRAAG